MKQSCLVGCKKKEENMKQTNNPRVDYSAAIKIERTKFGAPGIDWTTERNIFVLPKEVEGQRQFSKLCQAKRAWRAHLCAVKRAEREAVRTVAERERLLRRIVFGAKAIADLAARHLGTNDDAKKAAENALARIDLLLTTVHDAHV